MADDAFTEFLAATGNLAGGYAKHLETLRAELHELRRQNAKLLQREAKPKKSPRTHLVIGDAHSDPEVPNDRFRWLGRMVADLRPEVVVSMGDWADMGSLCSYDKGRRTFEGRRYWKDVAAAKDAREKFANEVAKCRGYKPELEDIEGNHEARIDKATDETPALDGLISTEDLGAAEFGWRVHKFLVPVTIDGITYIHYAPSGVMSRPIGGMNHAASLVRLGLTSVVVGHSHTHDYCERTRLDGKKVFALAAGCAFEQFMPWAGPANAMYARGIAVIRDVVDGYGSVSWTPLETIKRRYA